MTQGVLTADSFMGGVDASLPWTDLPLEFSLRNGLRFTADTVEDEYVRHIFSGATSRGPFFNVSALAWAPLLVVFLSDGSHAMAKPMLVLLNLLTLVVAVSRVALAWHLQRCSSRPAAVRNAHWHEVVDVATLWLVALMLAVTLLLKIPSAPTPLQAFMTQAAVLCIVTLLSPWRVMVTIPAQSVALGSLIATNIILAPGIPVLAVVGGVAISFAMLCLILVIHERSRRQQFCSTVFAYRAQRRRRDEVDELACVVAATVPHFVLRAYVERRTRFCFSTAVGGSVAVANVNFGAVLASPSGAVEDAPRLFGVALTLADRLGIHVLGACGDNMEAVAARWEHGRCGTLAMCTWAWRLCLSARRHASTTPRAAAARRKTSTQLVREVVALLDLCEAGVLELPRRGSLCLRFRCPLAAWPNRTQPSLRSNVLKEPFCRSASSAAGSPVASLSGCSVMVSPRLALKINRLLVKVENAALRSRLRPVLLARLAGMGFHGLEGVDRFAAFLPLRAAPSVALARATFLRCRSRAQLAAAADGQAVARRRCEYQATPVSKSSRRYRSAEQTASLLGKPFRAAFTAALVGAGRSATTAVTSPSDVSGGAMNLRDELEMLARAVAAGGGGSTSVLPLREDESRGVDGVSAHSCASIPACLHRVVTYLFPGIFRDAALEATFRSRTSRAFRVGCLASSICVISLEVAGFVQRGGGYFWASSSSSFGTMFQDICEGTASVLSLFALLFIRRREADPLFDAFCLVVPLAIYALPFSTKDALNPLPLMCVFGGLLTVAHRHHVGLHFLLMAVMVLPTMMVFSRTRPVECVMTLLASFAFYVMCAQQERARRHVFLTSEALWQRIAAAAAAEVQLFRACTADCLLPATKDSKRFSRINCSLLLRRGPSTWTMRQTVLMWIEFSFEQAASSCWTCAGRATTPSSVSSSASASGRRRVAQELVRRRCGAMDEVERNVRDLMRFLPSLSLAMATGDAWLVTSAPFACSKSWPTSSSPSSLRPRPPSPVPANAFFRAKLALLDHLEQGGPMCASVEAHLLASRLPLLAEARDGVTTASSPPSKSGRRHGGVILTEVTCVLHFGEVEVIMAASTGQPPQRENDHRVFDADPCDSSFGSWPLSADLRLAQRLCHEAKTFGGGGGVTSTGRRRQDDRPEAMGDRRDGSSSGPPFLRCSSWSCDLARRFRCVATSAFLAQLNIGFEQTRVASSDLFDNNVRRMRNTVGLLENAVTLPPSRAPPPQPALPPSPRPPTRAKKGRRNERNVHFCDTMEQPAEPVTCVPPFLFAGDLIPWMHDTLIFSASQRWALRDRRPHGLVGDPAPGGCRRVVFVSQGRYCWQLPAANSWFPSSSVPVAQDRVDVHNDALNDGDDDGEQQQQQQQQHVAIASVASMPATATAATLKPVSTSQDEVNIMEVKPEETDPIGVRKNAAAGAHPFATTTHPPSTSPSPTTTSSSTDVVVVAAVLESHGGTTFFPWPPLSSPPVGWTSEPLVTMLPCDDEDGVDEPRPIV